MAGPDVTWLWVELGVAERVRIRDSEHDHLFVVTLDGDGARLLRLYY